jgi:hypothetical protein
MGQHFFYQRIFLAGLRNYPPKTLLYAGFLSSSVTFFIQMYAYDPFSLAMIRAMAGFSAGIYPAVLILYVYNLERSIGKFSSFMPLGWALGNLLAGVIAVYWEIFAVASLLFALSFLQIPKLEQGKRPIFFRLNSLKRTGIFILHFSCARSGQTGYG